MTATKQVSYTPGPDNTPPNPLPCGCVILGTPTLNVEGTKLEFTNRHIKYCQLHAAAPDMAESLQHAAKCLRQMSQRGNGEYSAARLRADAEGLAESLESALKKAGLL